MGTIIILIIVFFVLKFIYDTYLSDNTDKNFSKYRKKNPIDAAKIEFPTTTEEFDDLVNAISDDLYFKNKVDETNKKINDSMLLKKNNLNEFSKVDLQFDGFYYCVFENSDWGIVKNVFCYAFMFGDEGKVAIINSDDYLNKDEVLYDLNYLLLIGQLTNKKYIDYTICTLSKYKIKDSLLSFEYSDKECHYEIKGSLIENGINIERILTYMNHDGVFEKQSFGIDQFLFYKKT